MKNTVVHLSGFINEDQLSCVGDMPVVIGAKDESHYNKRLNEIHICKEDSETTETFNAALLECYRQAVCVQEELDTKRASITVEQAQMIKQRLNSDYIIEGDLLRCYRGKRPRVAVPRRVKRIGDSAFLYNSYIRHVIIPSNVISIGSAAFCDCKLLYTMEIAHSVIVIGEAAFFGCSSLKNIQIPSSVTQIGSEAFEGCTSLVYNEYENGFYLGDEINPYIVLVKVNSENTSLVVNENTKIIYADAFGYNTSLKSITIPETLIRIGYGAFSQCVSLDYNKYDNAYYLGNATNPYVVLIKANSQDITSCVINKKTKIIHSCAFAYCTLLTDIEIPDSVISIEDYAFYNCRSLKNISLSNNVRHIGQSAFSDTALKRL